MNICKFAQDVHDNAKKHGWWDEDRSFGTITALIASEWSEALEEYRAGRPAVWYACLEAPKDGMAHLCCPKDEFDCQNFEKVSICKYHSQKPEGFAVELIDGCLRILDWFGREGIQIAGPNTVDKLVRQAGSVYDKMIFPDAVSWLNLYVSRAFFEYGRNGMNENKEVAQKRACLHLLEAMAIAFRLVKNSGNDPEEILQFKHEYNVTRSYKHGNKLC